MGLFISMVNASYHTQCVSLSNRKCMTQPTLINLHPNKYNQEFHSSAFAVKLDRCARSCNTLNDFSNKLCIQKEAKYLNLTMLNVITGINESKKSTKHVPFE